jgi:hypothetical protein
VLAAPPPLPPVLVNPDACPCVACGALASKSRDTYWCHAYRQRINAGSTYGLDGLSLRTTTSYRFVGFIRLAGVVCPACADKAAWKFRLIGVGITTAVCGLFLIFIATALELRQAAPLGALLAALWLLFVVLFMSLAQIRTHCAGTILYRCHQPALAALGLFSGGAGENPKVGGREVSI